MVATLLEVDVSRVEIIQVSNAEASTYQPFRRRLLQITTVPSMDVEFNVLDNPETASASQIKLNQILLVRRDIPWQCRSLRKGAALTDKNQGSVFH